MGDKKTPQSSVKNKIWLTLRALLIGVLAGLVFGIQLGLARANEIWERGSTEAGHAEFYLDADYTKHWRWKETKE